MGGGLKGATLQATRSSIQSARAAQIFSLPFSRTRMCHMSLHSRSVLSSDCGGGQMRGGAGQAGGWWAGGQAGN